MDEQLYFAKVVGQQDIAPFDPLMRAAEDRGDKIFSLLTAGKARLLRSPSNKEQPRMHLPQAALPQFPGQQLMNRRQTPNFA